MKAQIIKYTGEMETVQVEQIQENGSKKMVDQEQEVTEVVQEKEFTEDEKTMVAKQAQLRAAMLSRDTGFRHVVKID